MKSDQTRKTFLRNRTFFLIADVTLSWLFHHISLSVHGGLLLEQYEHCRYAQSTHLSVLVCYC